MGGESGGVEESLLSSSCCSSPKNKVKFLCSHGGKVLPRPSDGTLKYVGGETRVISVPPHITFSELMKKLNEMVEGDMVLKYQLVPEDLDALVSVRTDEDLKHMIDEHDRHENGGAPLLRAFLFHSKPVLVEKHHPTAAASSEPYALEQRYIDAINGINRTSPKSKLVAPIRASSSTCSAYSSPKSTSPDGHTTDLIHESPFHPSGRLVMNRVRSSPSITSLSNLHSPSIRQPQHDHGHHHNQNQNQSQYLVSYPSSSRAATAQPPPIMSMAGIGGGGKTDMNYRGTGNGNGNGYNNNYYYSSSSRPHKVFAYYDDTAATYAHPMFERVVNVARSPRKSTIWG